MTSARRLPTWKPGRIFRQAEGTVEDDSDIIVRLLAPRGTRTPSMWAHKHNESFFIAGSYKGSSIEDHVKSPDEKVADETSVDNSRVSSPDRAASDDDSGEDAPAELRLTFSKDPKHIGSGFVFGSSKRLSDIYCGTAKEGFSDRMFLISYDEDGNLYLETLAEKRTTEVFYNDQKGGKRRAFRWTLFEDAESIRVFVDGKLDFNVILPKHEDCRKKFEEKRREFLFRKACCAPFVDDNKSYDPSRTRSTTGAGTPINNTLYYRVPKSKIGQGTYGKVSIVRDVSDGTEYAAKEFNDEFRQTEADTLQKMDHEHIVKYVCTDTVDTPHLLIMEYLPRGDLRQVVDLGICFWEEVAPLLYQLLQGLEHMHSRNVAHLDIKPENILLVDHDAYYKVKIGDLGLAREGSYFGTACGSRPYAAPEIARNERYSAKVDIWSTGVVIYELLAGGLPKPSSGHMRGISWCNDIVRLAREFFGRPGFPDNKAFLNMSRILLHNMLQIDPGKRMSAQECIEQGTGAVGSPTVFRFVEEMIYSEDRIQSQSNSSEATTGLGGDKEDEVKSQTTTGIVQERDGYDKQAKEAIREPGARADILSRRDWVDRLADKEIEESGAPSISEFIPSVDEYGADVAREEANSSELVLDVSSADEEVDDNEAVSSERIIRPEDEPAIKKVAQKQTTNSEELLASTTSGRKPKRQRTTGSENATIRPTQGIS